jgi:hypothetical protein
MNTSTFKILRGIPFLLLVVLLSIFYQRANAQQVKFIQQT